jgi:nucleotide-binding universal stress UspA family protein
MDNSPRYILVPLDFTSASDYALEHAINIAKVMNLSISLLHIINHQKEEADSRAKLAEIAEITERQHGITVSKITMIGNIFTTISEIASQDDCAVVVMKTSGPTGVQKYTGSRAIKIIKGSKAPYIVVQKAPSKDKFVDIVYPIDYRVENKELLSYILNFSKFYEFKLHLIKVHTTDRVFLKNVTNNLNFAKSMLESRNLTFQVFHSTGKSDYATEINDYAHSVNADLIITQLQRNLTLSKFIFGVKEQKIIANPYKIPVMCVNPKDLWVFGGFR